MVPSDPHVGQLEPRDLREDELLVARAERRRVAGVDHEVDVEAPRELLREPVAERRQMDVGDVKDPDLISPAQRVGLDGRVRARGARHDPAELIPEIPDALDRALHRTEELRHQPERAGVAGRLECGGIETHRGEADREDDREKPGERRPQDRDPLVPEGDQSEGRRAGDTHEDHQPGEPARGVEDVPFDLGGDGVDPSSESFLQRLDVDLLEGRTEVQGSDVRVGSEPPERRQRDVGHAPAEVGLELDLERTGVDRRLRERLQCDRGARDADQDGSDDVGPTGHPCHGGHRSSGHGQLRKRCFSGRLECSFGGRDFPSDLDERLQERG